MKGLLCMRLPLYGLLASTVFFLGTTHAAPRQARLGDQPAFFDAQLGKPADVASSGSTTLRKYQPCGTQAPSAYRYTVFFIKGRAYRVLQFACSGHVPGDWRNRAARFLPTDARFNQTREVDAMPAYDYRSRVLAKAFPNSACSAYPQARGLVTITESPDEIEFVTLVVACMTF
jgi:hypothetical protein